MNEQEMIISPVEEQISQELVKHNVTDALIEKLKADYLPLQIADINDKETYLLVKDARKECKKWRVMAKKICTQGREEAVAIQKAWVAKEKEVIEKIGEVEDHLEKQEKEFEAAVAAEKERRKREQEEQLIMRQQVLTGMGAMYSDGNFVLGEVSFEMSLIKECDPEIWDNDIKPKFEVEYQKIEAERIEQDRVKAEKEAELKRQQEELEQQRLELQRQQEQLRQAQEEQERKERERLAEEDRIKKEKFEKKFQDRLTRGHYDFNGFTVSYKGKIFGSKEDLVAIPHDDFEELVAVRELEIADEKTAEEQKRLAEIEAQKEVARRNEIRKQRISVLNQYGATTADDLAEYSDEQWETLLDEVKTDHEKKQREKWEKEQEEKRQKEEAERVAKMEAAKDKEKWDEMMAQVTGIEVYEMRSSQYRTKAKRFRELLDQIKSL